MTESNVDSAPGLLTIEPREPLDQIAYRRVKEAILTGHWAPGDPIVERQVARILGVSKTPVRKALGRLEQEGLVTSDPYKGHSVAVLTNKDISDIYDFRSLVECYAIRETIGTYSSQELQDMESTLQAADEAIDGADVGAFLAANWRFHRSFALKYGNLVILDQLNRLDERIRWILTTAIRADHSIMDSSRHQHRLIFEAVRQNDAETAVSRMHDHFTSSLPTVSQRLVQWKEARAGE